MKHVRSITNRKPVLAGSFRSVFCDVIGVVHTVLEAVGGSVPLITLSAQKCYIIPTPNDEQGYPGDMK